VRVVGALAARPTGWLAVVVGIANAGSGLCLTTCAVGAGLDIQRAASNAQRHVGACNGLERVSGALQATATVLAVPSSVAHTVSDSIRANSAVTIHRVRAQLASRSATLVLVLPSNAAQAVTAQE